MAVDSPNTPKTESTNVEDLAEENIDPRVLELLGLQDIFDLDYGDYKTLLIGKLNENDLLSSKGKGLETDDVTLLREELLRVRKKRSGRFKVSTKKIKANKFFDKDSGSDATQAPKKVNLLPHANVPGAIQKLPDNIQDENGDQKNVELQNKKDDEILSVVKEIKELVITIADSMKKQLQEKQKLASLSSRESEKAGRSSREKKMEQKPSFATKMVEQATKPFVSIFDTIKNFLLNVLLGSLANWLFSVIQNPKMLLQPIQSLLDGIFGFFNNILQFIDNNVVQPVRSFIDLINSAISGFIGIINKAMSIIPGSTPIDAPQVPNIPDIPDIKAPNITGTETAEPQKSQPNIQVKNQGGNIVGSDIKILKSIQNLNVDNSQKINNVVQKTSGGGVPKMNNKIAETGGIVSGSTGLDISGLGPDTQLTALKKNEFVLVPGAAQAIGIPFLESMNKKYGGNNASTFASVNDIKIRTAAGGGGIDLWGISPSRNTKLSSSSDFSSVPSHHRSYSAFRGAIPADYAVVRTGINPAAVPSHGRGLSVVSGVSGKVGFAGYADGAGNMVEIVNNKGEKLIRLLHLDKIKTKTGSTVSPSTIIGTQGNTGTRDIHVHVDGSKAVHTNWIRATLGGNYEAGQLAPDSGGGGGGAGGGGGGSGSQPPAEESVDFSKFAEILGDKRGDIIMSGEQKSAYEKAGMLPPSAAQIAPTPPKSNVPTPPTAGTPQILNLAAANLSAKPVTSGSMTGNTGTPPVNFSSINMAEFSHYTAVKSLLNILEY